MGNILSYIYLPFSYLMKGCLFITGDNYFFALFFFALAMQVILLPLAIKQQKSQIKMAQVRPMEMAIREKYAGRKDRATTQKMNMEIQEMYQKNGYNQLAGCLPMLIQLPVILILFTIVRQPITYATSLTSGDSSFVEKNCAAVVEYYQKEKEMLDPASYEGDEYKTAISNIEKKQKNLGGDVKKDEDGNEVTNNGLTVYEYNKANGYPEMALSSFLAYGQEETEALIEAKHIDASIIDVFNESGFGKYKEELPEFKIFGLDLNEYPSGVFSGSISFWFVLVPILVFLSQFGSTKLSKKMNPNMANANAGKGTGLFLELGLPLLTTYFAFTMPAAIGVYWIWRTLLGGVQTVVIAKAMPIPPVTDEQIAEAKKALKGNGGKRKKQITIEVDEDDNSYDELVVKKSSDSSNPDRPRRIEMLTADDEPAAPADESPNNEPEPAEDDGKKE